MFDYICQSCGIAFQRRARPSGPRKHKYCSSACRDKGLSGPGNSNWKGGRIIPKEPRRYVTVQTVRKNGKRGQVKEHILLAEKALGRPLPEKAQCHHLNGDSRDNSPGNVVICEDAKYHRLLHARMRRLKDVGDLNHKRCTVCKRIKPLCDFARLKTNWDGRYSNCKVCKYERKRAYRASGL